jgi:hypothetical protein
MRFHKPLAIAAMMCALAVGTLAAPAVAQLDPVLALVNGSPGRSVDVCTGNNEVRSGLRYGAFTVRTVGLGSRTIRFRAASPGRCKGTTLAQTTLILVADDDRTVVATRRAPKVVVFDNRPFPATTNGRATFRYAGDLGDINVAPVFIGFAAPAAPPPPYDKGDQSHLTFTVPFAVSYNLFLAGRSQPFRETAFFSIPTGQRLEVILVGSSLRNDRVVLIRRPIPAP